MGRFARRRRDDRAWVSRLPEPFSLDDVMGVVGTEELPAALGWLYDAIEHGRIEPVQEDHGMRYVFAGERRQDDGEPRIVRSARR